MHACRKEIYCAGDALIHLRLTPVASRRHALQELLQARPGRAVLLRANGDDDAIIGLAARKGVCGASFRSPRWLIALSDLGLAGAFDVVYGSFRWRN